MKEIINYYYNLDCLEIEESKNYSTFNSFGNTFYFVFFNRTKEELDDLVQIVQELIQRGVKTHIIVQNKFGKYLTKVGEHNYVMLKLNGNKDEEISIIDINEKNGLLRLNQTNSKLYRNNWAELWSSKVDYFENQIRELGKDKDIVLNSFSYYIGLSENAISYVNKINKVIGLDKTDNITLSHRRIFYPNISLNYYNPLSYIFDIEVRDIAEYLKSCFFGGNNALDDLDIILKTKKFSNYSYHMLYARLLYPTYYFDVYEGIINNNLEEEKLIPIISKVNEYEEFLKKAYQLISKYTSLERIDWLLKKEL